MQGVPLDANATLEANEVVRQLGWELVKPGLLYNYVTQQFVGVKDSTLYTKLTDDSMIVLPLPTHDKAQTLFNKLVKDLAPQ